MDKIIDDDEDEDIVIQGSALYEHLCNIGYTDFETAPVKKISFKRTYESKVADLINYVKSAFKNIFSIYSWIMQEDSISKKQLETISSAKVLLDDHAYKIQDDLEKYSSKPWRCRLQKLITIGAIITSSVYVSTNTRYQIPISAFAFSTFFTTGYVKYSRVHAQRNLRSIISLQDKLFDLCKKGLKILRYGYKIKLSRGKSGQQLYELTADRLKYLQPITESLIRYMEDVSFIYYQISKILAKLLPMKALPEDAWTRFDNELFALCGEVNYQELKNLYNVYILTQSDMLHLLAIAYNGETWRPFCKKIPEKKLAYIVRPLIKYLTIYENDLSNIIGAYYNVKIAPLTCKHKGPITSEWQDLYVHLYLTSNKLQSAYNQILSTMQEIDNTGSETAVDNELVEIMMEKLNEAYKEIDAARNFAEFSTLLIAKTRLNNRTTNRVPSNAVPTNEDVNFPVITNSEPEIVDEVFEEYIKEEYLKPLYEEGDEVSLENYKWDKFLAKNFMIELKEALTDKQKSMSERESKALQRMYKSMIKDNDSKIANNLPQIPIPPPMPTCNISSTAPKRTSMEAREHVSNDTPDKAILQHSRIKLLPKKKFKELNPDDSSDEETRPVPFIPLPKVEMQSSPFALSLPPPFLKAGEETFIGSGENSEAEFVDDEEEDEQNETARLTFNN